VSAVLARSPRRTLAAMLVALTAAALASAMLASAASAGIVSQRDRSGDIRDRGLTAAERRALDIVSVTAVGAEEFGVMVTVRFRGNIERALGRGHLRRAVVAMVSQPRSRRRRPAILATRGPGAFGQTLRRTRSTQVLVLRNGRELTFLIVGPGLSNVRRIHVLAFAEVRGTRSRRSAGTSQLTGGILDEIFSRLAESRRGDEDRGILGTAGLFRMPTCDQLRRELEETDDKQADIARKLERAQRERRRSAVERLEESSDRLLDRAAELRRQIAARPCPGSMTTPPPDGGFSLSVMGSHRHPGGPTSELCVDIKTSPPRPGASARVRVTGADGSTAERTITLDSNGEGRVRGTIGVKQRYDIDVTVTATDGTTASGSTSHTVGDAQGSCPPP
jgi:hypothetical protein